jgi:cation:H+ antiporter
MVFNFFTGGSPMISRTDGMILLVCFGLFMWYSFHRDRKAGKTEEEAPAEEDRTPFWLAVVKVVGGLAVLITSCDFFVDNAVPIAKSFGVNDAFISLTLIACGTSLPELAASVAAALKKNTQLALGNVIGSNIFNITWILGLSSQVMPLNSSGITGADYCVMVAAALLPVIIGFKGKIGRAGGALLFIGFLAYNWYLISNQIV